MYILCVKRFINVYIHNIIQVITMKKMAKPEKKQIPVAGAGLDAIIDKYKEKSEPSSREEAFKSFITSTSKELYGINRMKPKFSFSAFGRPSGVAKIPRASFETRCKANLMRLMLV